ncbi:MAG TPA: crossover junction endodeoxyribonuclease RuvC [Anaerolineae bacterium]|nr:crossover junction endodeoxyribonuclease RuvC [Anaerolineae bacterium]
MLVIGIDPGTASTGYGVIRHRQDGGLELVDYGVIATPAGDPMPDRLCCLHEKLCELLALHQPESGAVEKLYYQRNVSTAISVGQARGVSLLAFAQASIPVDEYNPRVIKQSVTGYGSAEKRQVQEMVRSLLGMQELPRPDDAADALAVAICHLHASQTRQRMEDMA